MLDALLEHTSLVHDDVTFMVVEVTGAQVFAGQRFVWSGFVGGERVWGGVPCFEAAWVIRDAQARECSSFHVKEPTQAA